MVTCKGPHNKRIVMEKVLGDFDLISSSMPQSFLPPKVALATWEIVLGMCVSLQKTKHTHSNVQLVVKHNILTT